MGLCSAEVVVYAAASGLASSGKSGILLAGLRGAADSSKRGGIAGCRNVRALLLPVNSGSEGIVIGELAALVESVDL
jgi:hypothetical protein